MNKFTPWKIENGTLQLLPWEHGAGDVLVTVDVFASDVSSDNIVGADGRPIYRAFDDAMYPETPEDNYRVGMKHLRADLFAHIDANPQATFHLRTMHPERVRDVWCQGGIPYLGPMDRSPEETATEWANRLVRTQLRRPNVTLSALIHTQEEADQRLPVLLELASLCREVYPMCRPVERIDLTHVDEFVEVVNQGSYSRVSDTWLGFQWTFPIPRIVVSGGPEPMHPDHVRDLKGQAEAAGVQFVFMGWGDWWPESQGCGQELDRNCDAVWQCVCGTKVYPLTDLLKCHCGDTYTEDWCRQLRVGSENSGHMLDGKAYPWESEVKA